MAEYVTIAEVKGHSPGVQWKAVYDELVPDLIVRASELVDRETRREIGAYDASADASVRYFDGEGGLHQGIDECTAVTAVAVRLSSGTTTWTSLEITDYYTWPYNASAATGPIVRLDVDRRQGTYSEWPSGREAIKVTAKWGYSDNPPAVVKEAVIAQVTSWIMRGEKMFADTGLAANLGRLMHTSGLDKEVKNMLINARLVKKKDLF